MSLGQKTYHIQTKKLLPNMTSTSALEEQIVALVQRLKETKETERLEEACKEAERKEAEATAERAHLEEEERRLWEEAEA